MANTSLEFRDSVGSGNAYGAQTSTTALAANSARTGWQIQNLDTAILYVKLGAGASSSSYNFVLKAGTGAADGTAGSFAMMDGNVWRGIVTVASAGTPSYAVIEL